MEFKDLKEILLEMEFEEEDINLEANLEDGVGMDSTEAVEFFATVSDKINKKIESKEIKGLVRLPINELIQKINNLKENENSNIIVDENNVAKRFDKGGEMKILISPKTASSKNVLMGVCELKRDEILIKHLHDYSDEAIYILEGKGIVSIDNKEYEVSKGMSVLVNKGLEHEIINNNEETLKLIFASAPLAGKDRLGDRIIQE